MVEIALREGLKDIHAFAKWMSRILHVCLLTKSACYA